MKPATVAVVRALLHGEQKLNRGLSLDAGGVNPAIARLLEGMGWVTRREVWTEEGEQRIRRVVIALTEFGRGEAVKLFDADTLADSKASQHRPLS